MKMAGLGMVLGMSVCLLAAWFLRRLGQKV